MEDPIINDKDPVVIEVKIMVSKNPHGIPAGTFIDCRIMIIDEYETIRTSNAKVTRDLAKVAPKGATAKYSERLQKTIVYYPGKSKKAIAKIVSEDLKKIPTK